MHPNMQRARERLKPWIMERHCGCRRNIDFLPYIFQCSRNGNKILLPLKYLTSCVLCVCVILVMDNACVYQFKYLLFLANRVRKRSLLFLRLLFRTAKCTAESTQSLILMFPDTCGPQTSQIETALTFKPGTMYFWILDDHLYWISIKSFIRQTLKAVYVEYSVMTFPYNIRE